ncbi:MAG TPA: aldose 1-epimerase family protein [Acidimicrobiales bacterium]|nr:aldose 1-epimerase family protein [Acidimicrobiales bacterium]
MQPSGQQIELVSGSQRAAITEVGAGLRSYTIEGADVLDGYGEHQMSSGGRGQLLIPWPNRIRDGRYEFGGTEHQTPLSEPEHGNAIHGLVRWANWRLDQHGPDNVTATYVLHPQVGYPFTLGLEVVYSLSASGLRVVMAATNLGSEPLPYGAGQHPYFTVGTDRVDEAVLSVPAESVLEADERGIPTGRTLPVAGTERDYRQPRSIGSAVVDTCYADIARDADATARVILERSGRSPRLTVWMDASFGYIMVFTGDTLEPARRRRGLAVEPMTCAPDAFRSGDGLQILEPGQQTTSAWGVTPG